VTQANIAHDGGDNNGFDPGNGFREEYARIWGKMQAKAPNGAAPARLRRTGPGLFLLIFKFTFQIQSVANFPPRFWRQVRPRDCTRFGNIRFLPQCPRCSTTGFVSGAIRGTIGGSRALEFRHLP